MYRPHAPQQHPEVKMPKGSARFRAQASKGAAFLGGSAGRALGDPGRKVVAVRLADVGRSAGEAPEELDCQSVYRCEMIVCRPRLSPDGDPPVDTSFFRLVRFFGRERYGARRPAISAWG